MEFRQNWANTKLSEYFLYDHWLDTHALAALAGFDTFPLARSSNIFDLAILDEVGLRSLPPEQIKTELARLRKNFLYLNQIWLSRFPRVNTNSFPPDFYIEWALSKRFRPEWLDWAIDRSLYTPKQEIAQPVQIASAPAYSTAWLTIQLAAINQFFNPRRNPDAKKEEVTDWIKEQAVAAGLPDSQNVASTIFTIIKPENHDPKKKGLNLNKPVFMRVTAWG